MDKLNSPQISLSPKNKTKQTNKQKTSKFYLATRLFGNYQSINLFYLIFLQKREKVNRNIETT